MNDDLPFDLYSPEELEHALREAHMLRGEREMSEAEWLLQDEGDCDGETERAIEARNDSQQPDYD